MADPLSIAASVAGLVSLGLDVTGALIDYYQDYKHQDSDVAAMMCHIKSVHRYFEQLSQVIAERTFQGDESLTGNVESSVTKCDSLLQKLQKRYSKFEKPSGDLRTRLEAACSRARYPFRKSTLEKIKENAEEIRDNISPVLQLLQLKDNKRIHDRTTEIKTLVEIGFFYFTFSDESKQNTSAMLKALLLQLSSQHSSGENILSRLHDKYGPGTLPVYALEDALGELLSLFANVFVFVDALDESPWQTARGEVLDTLNRFRDWNVPGLHLLVTSRDLHDIRDDIQPLPEEDIAMIKNEGVDQDIASYIAGRLDTDRRLAKWKPFRSKIEDGLTLRARGVFRWVDCQFTLLQSCPRTESHLEERLQSLPADLDETYERMLLEVQRRGLAFDLWRVLLQLCYAHRPMMIAEVIDGLAVDVGDQAGLNLNRQLQDEDDVLQICSGFVEVDIQVVADHLWSKIFTKFKVLRIAHFTVQEYLESDRLPKQVGDNFGLNAAVGHQEITKICLTYLSHPGLSVDPLAENSFEATIGDYPLAYYAARLWHEHYKRASSHGDNLDVLVLPIFTDPQIYANWAITLGSLYNRRGTDIPGLLYFPALWGLENICLGLLQLKAPNHIQELVNAEGSVYGTALHAACVEGHTKIAKLLLEHGTDVNIQAGSRGTALQAAAARRFTEAMEILLKHGADANIQGGYYETALQAAAWQYKQSKNCSELTWTLTQTLPLLILPSRDSPSTPLLTF